MLFFCSFAIEESSESSQDHELPLGPPNHHAISFLWATFMCESTIGMYVAFVSFIIIDSFIITCIDKCF